MSGREAAAALAALADDVPPRSPCEREEPALPPAREVRSRPGSRDRAPVVLSSREPPSVRFDGVTYTYSARHRPALHDVSFDLAPGATVALVGASGAGKTTLAHVLLGFLAPQAGAVFAGDLNLADADLDVWRSRLAWVPQRPWLFAGTVLDNLLLARPGASAADVRRAIERADADDMIARFPRGLETPVGDRGERLSGGELQRLALARAFLRDAPLLVLDEPMAHLDPEHAGAVQDALRRLRAGRTVLLIAHRPDAAREADTVVLLDRGRVVRVSAPAVLPAPREETPQCLEYGRTA
jgi:ABC-type multidrug transport system fused ATPase/permease subunit